MWRNVCTYQSPEPAFFTMDMPALDGGERHRVGVLKTERETKREGNMKLHHTQDDIHMPDNNDQNITVHSLTDSIKPLTMERHSQQPQNH